MSSRRRVVVTGLGALTPLGNNVQKSWARLIKSECGITKLQGSQFDILPVKIAGLIPDFDAASWQGLKEYKDLGKLSTFQLYGMAAAEEALRDAGWGTLSSCKLTEKEKERTGVCIGSGIGSVDDIAQVALDINSDASLKRVRPSFVPKILVNLIGGHLSIKHGFMGPNHAVSTACTTGAHAIGDAMRFIEYGDADVMIAGSAEAPISPIGFAGFIRAKSLTTTFNHDPSAASRPFDRLRNGFVMGEGAGVMVLEEYEHAKSRGAKIYAELAGYGLSADAHHYTAPPSHGTGAVRAMQRALETANLSPSDINYINCHATSTRIGDLAENRAIKRVFGEQRQRPQWSPITNNALNTEDTEDQDFFCVSSTKGATGHLLGAAGSVEAIFTVLAIHTGTLPPTLNLTTPSSSTSSNEEQREDEEEKEKEFTLDYIPRQGYTGMKVKAALTNSFGFGGTNASLCFKRYL